jgi:hypothetical protein
VNGEEENDGPCNGGVALVIGVTSFFDESRASFDDFDLAIPHSFPLESVDFLEIVRIDKMVLIIPEVQSIDLGLDHVSTKLSEYHVCRWLLQTAILFVPSPAAAASTIRIRTIDGS